MSMFNLKLQNSVPNINDRFLDLVLTNVDGFLVARETLPLVAEDLYHPALIMNWIVPRPFKFDDPPCLTYNFNRADFYEIYVKLDSLDWDDLYKFTDVNLAVDYFYGNVNAVLSECVPVKKLYKNHKFPCWFSADIIRDIRRKNHCARKRRFSNYHDKMFRELRRDLKVRINLAYMNYVKLTESNIKSDTKNFWNFVNNKRNTQQVQNKMFFKNECFAGGMISAGFAKYFSSVFTSSSLPQVCNFDNDCYFYDLRNDNAIGNLDIVSFSLAEIRWAINRLKSKKSFGPDGIPAYLVKGCIDIFIPKLFFIFNLSLKTSCFPSKWKEAKIVPVFKSGNRCDISNYRPISIINVFAKVYEKLLYKHIWWHVKPLIFHNQHGFVSGKSVLSNLLSFVEDVMGVLDKGGRVDVIYTDFVKAFDTVDHEILLKKLYLFGLSKRLLLLFASYLKDRMQYVSFRNVSSDRYCSTSGVPQGSNLGPLLFLLFVNDLPDVLTACECSMYADDVKLYRIITDDEDCGKIQDDVNKLLHWCDSNKLFLNPKKCKALVISRQRNVIPPVYFIGNEPLSIVNSVRDLGVIIDRHLDFDYHLQVTINEANKMLGFLIRHTINFTDIFSIKILYYSLVRSKLEYSVQVWSPYTLSSIHSLECVQNRFLRFLYFKLHHQLCPYDYSVTSLRGVFNMKSLKLRRDLLLLIMLFKTLNNSFDCACILNRFNFYIPCLRRGRYLSAFIPRCNTTSYACSPLNTTLRLFNYVSHIDPGIDIFFNNINQFKKLCSAALA